MLVLVRKRSVRDHGRVPIWLLLLKMLRRVIALELSTVAVVHGMYIGMNGVQLALQRPHKAGNHIGKGLSNGVADDVGHHVHLALLICVSEETGGNTAMPPCARAKTVTYIHNRYISVTNFMIGL